METGRTRESWDASPPRPNAASAGAPRASMRRLRRSAPAVVALLAGFAAVAAQAQQAPPDPLPNNAPQVGPAPAAQLPNEISFNFSEAPWDEVARWLADAAKMSLLVESKPAGSFSYFDKRKYTFPEALDVINSVLLTKGHVFLIRNNFLVLADLKDGVPPHLVDRVDVRELPHKGRTELVKVLLTLKGLVAQEAKKEFESMSSPYGRIISLDSTNQLLIVDTAQTVQQIVDLILELEGDQGAADLRAFPLKYVSARDIERVVRDLLGLAARDAPASPGPGGGSSSDSGRRRGGDDDERRERFREMMQQFMGQGGQPGGGPQQPGQGPRPSATGPFVSVDERTNTLFVSATPDKLALVAQVVQRLDVPQTGDEAVEQTPRIEVYPVTAGDASGLANVLQSVFSATADLKVTAHPDGQALIVYATPRDHERLKTVLAQIKSEGIRVEVIPLRVLDATSTATLIQSLLGQKEDQTSRPRFRFSFFDQGSAAAKTGPSIEADVDRNRLVVRGTESQIAEIRGLLVKLGEAGLAAGGDSGRYRVIPLSGQDPKALAESVERIWNRLESKTPIRVEVLTPRRGPDAERGGTEAEAPERPLPPQERSGRPDPRRNDPAPGRPGDPPGLDDVRRGQDAGRSVRLVGYQPEDGELAEPPNDRPSPASARDAAEPQSPVTIVVGPDNIAVFSEDPQALDMIEGLLNTVVRGEQTSSFAYYYLKIADAQEVAYLLDEALYGERRQSVFFSEPVDKNRARILPDTRSNAILVVGPPSEQRKIEQLLQAIDREDRPDTNATQRPYVIPVRYADANEMAAVVRDVFAAQIFDPASRQRPNIPNVNLGGFGAFGTTSSRRSNQGQDAQQGKLTVGVDQRTNSIVVSAPGELYQEVEQLVRMLDEAARNQGRSARVVTLKNTSPEAIENALGNLFGVRTTAELKEERSERARARAEQDQRRREDARDDDRRNRRRDLEDAIRGLGNQNQGQFPGFSPRPFFPF